MSYWRNPGALRGWLPAGLSVLLTVWCTAAETKLKKLIELGWDEPDTQFLADQHQPRLLGCYGNWIKRERRRRGLLGKAVRTTLSPCAKLNFRCSSRAQGNKARTRAS